MATYVHLYGAGIELEPGVPAPRHVVDAILAVARAVVGDDEWPHVVYQPCTSVHVRPGEPFFGPYSSTDAWALVRESLAVMRETGDPGEWVLGTTTVHVAPSVATVEPETFTPALHLSLRTPLEELIDAIDVMFPGAAWEEARGVSATIAGVEVFVFENDPDEYDTLYWSDAQPSDWTWLLAAGSDKGADHLPAACTAFATPDAGLLDFLGSALDAKHAGVGWWRATREGVGNACRWLGVRSGLLVTEVSAPLRLDPTDRGAVLSYLESVEARWSSLTAVVTRARDWPRGDQQVVAEHRVRAGTHDVRVRARYEHYDDDSSALVLELSGR